jgi:hypothetical protein
MAPPGVGRRLCASSSEVKPGGFDCLRSAFSLFFELIVQ